MRHTQRTPVLWLNGPEGIGKSTVAFEIFRQLSDAGTKSAFVDLDQLNLCYPAPEDDPPNYRVRAVGLAAVWATYRDEGVRCMVMSGIAETKTVVEAHAARVPDAHVTIVRLRAAAGELRSRFVGRGGHADQADDVVQVADDMDRHFAGDLCVDTDGLALSQTVDLVRETAGGWPGLS